jgi:hypothetical protein
MDDDIRMEFIDGKILCQSRGGKKDKVKDEEGK